MVSEVSVWRLLWSPRRSPPFHITEGEDKLPGVGMDEVTGCFKAGSTLGPVEMMMMV